MTNRKHLFKKPNFMIAIAAILVLFSCAGCGGSGGPTVSLTILQTSDVHDHAGGYGSAASYSPLTTGDDEVLGGYARLASYISSVRNEIGDNNVLLCDSGDFTMGTVYSMTLASAPLAFTFFSMTDYDAVTIGNHETDLGPDALAGFLTSAQANTSAPFTTPIVASNMNTSASPAMNALVDNGSIVKSKIIDKSGIKIGVLGILGEDADFDAANAAPLTFDHNYATDLKEQVDELRANGAQLIVLLSHEGFTVNEETGFAEGNDAELAQAVPGIDVILSGHLHLNYTAAKASADCDTILVSPGEYGEHVARLDLKVDIFTGKVKSYTSVNPLIDDTILGSSTMNYVAATLTNAELDTALAPAFAALGLTGVDSILDTVAKNNAPITLASITTGYAAGESVLGNLAVDSYRNGINGIWAAAYAEGGIEAAKAAMTAATGDENRVQVSFVPSGVVRDAIAAESGTIAFADLYNTLPLGADTIDTSAFGYPLLTTFVKAADIYKILGISLQMGMIQANNTYVINFGGIYMQILPTTSLTGLGYDIYLCPTDTNADSPNYDMNGNIPSGIGTLINPADETTLYKIATDLYTLLMMYEVRDLFPDYGINTYDVNGALLPDRAAANNRVMTGATTTLRGWQSIVGWSWAASAHATSDLSDAGYTSELPYRRVQ